jgi:membrane protease YdiL (CAAX protease family)
MSANYLNRLAQKISGWRWLHSSFVFAIALPLWLLIGFGLSMVIAWVLLYVLTSVGVTFSGVDGTILNAAFAAVIYLLTLAFVVALPRVWHKYTTKKDIGLTRWPSWADIGLAPLGFIVYFIASSLLVFIASSLFSSLDLSQVQDVGFTKLSQSYEYMLAFVTLIVVAPVAEELLFRGFLYGKLKKHMPVWVAILITSALFGFIHGQWNVGLDVFALSIVLCSLREVTGNIWSGMLLHMLKNSVAFFIIFISPML